MVGIAKRRPRYHPTWTDPEVEELRARYYETACRVRHDNPWQAVVLKVQERRLRADLQKRRMGAVDHPTLRMLRHEIRRANVSAPERP